MYRYVYQENLNGGKFLCRDLTICLYIRKINGLGPKEFYA